MYYHHLGRYPHKRHVIFRKPDGGLYKEHLIGEEGFSNHATLAYHLYEPTRIRKVDDTPENVAPRIAVGNNFRPRAFYSFNVKTSGDPITARRPLMVNDDVIMGVAAPDQSMKGYFYRNAFADELLFIHEGSGTLHTILGKVPFRKGDYLVIPRSLLHWIEFDGDRGRCLYIESYSPIRVPERYLTRYGQFMEHSPFCERDIRPPVELETFDEKGEFPIKIKRRNEMFTYALDHHPFDVVGWDGYHWPYAFSIYDFEPITGRIHMPPPIHQTFEGRNYVICSFVPRLYDYHPESIPAPYNHSNIDTDEVLYYVEGEFMSRKHVEEGMFSLHPMGVPHGPHPGAVEKSIGQKETNELAVMIDTFRPLQLTEDAVNVEDPHYYLSWIEDSSNKK